VLSLFAPDRDRLSGPTEFYAADRLLLGALTQSPNCLSRTRFAGNIFVYKSGMAPQLPLGTRIHRHISAARAFHTDLIAETQRRLRVLTNLARHLNVLRSRDSTLAERLTAAELSRQELETLEQLRQSSVSTHRDLRNALRRVHHHLNRLVTGQRADTKGGASPHPS